MAGAPPQQQNNDNSLALLWGILLSFALIGFAWFFFHELIATWVLKLRLLEVYLIAWVIPGMHAWITQLESLTPYHLHFSDLAIISSEVGHYLRFPISLILLSFGLSVYRNQAALQFKRYYSMQTLAELEQQNWVQISPIVPLDLVNTPIDSGPWAMALTPFQFAKRHNLLELERSLPPANQVMMVITDRHSKARLKREAAQRVFTVQLGPLWEGIDALSMPTKALFAIFAARGIRDRKTADQLLAEITHAASKHLDKQGAIAHSNLNYASTEAVLKKYQSHPLIIKVTKQHAYVLGVMASMLVLARRDGVLASADFLWLKPCDRALWFMLNCIGRQTVYTEVAGPFSHWIAESAVKRKLRVPMVDVAVDALDEAIKEVRLPDATDY